MTTRRLLIRGGTVLVGPALTGRFVEADVLLDAGLIAEIRPGVDAPDAEVVDATGTFVLPGFVDAHAHLWEASMRGLTADWDIIDFGWGIRYNHATLHEPEDLYAGAQAGALASIDAGTTTVLDHVHALHSAAHADQALAAVRDSGLRAVWAYGLNDPPFQAPPFGSQAARWADVRRLRSALPDGGRVTLGLAPNDVLTVPWETTLAEFALARELDVVLTAHANTSWGPHRPPEFEFLAHDGLLGRRQVYSHGNASSDHELALLAEAGAALVSTPESELQMGLGTPLFARATDAGVTVALGADLQANNSPDAFAQMRLARQAENGRRHQPVLDGAGLTGLDGVAVTVRQVLHLATMGGATALGMAHLIGSLEPGKHADVVLLRNDSVRHRPIVDPFATIVEHSGVGDVDTVVVGGDVLKRNGRLPKDREANAAALVDATWARLADRMAQRGGPKPPRPDGLFEQVAASAAANLPAWSRSWPADPEHHRPPTKERSS